MKTVKTFRFSQEDLAVLDALGEELGTSEVDTLRAVVADGLKHRMEHCDPPIHPYFLWNMTPQAVVQEYLKYIDAVREKAGVMRPDGTPPEHYFAKVPKGGTWEKETPAAGGWAVLDKKTRFTKNGYERAV